ncbi:HAD-IA family hydrolase [Kineococcus sp. GCM10028916]
MQLQVAGAVETCQAVLFDMDGVLVDSMALIEEQLRQWAREHGVDPQLLVDLSPGRTNAELVAQVAPHLDAAAEERLLLEQEVATAGEVRACAGALELVAQLPVGAWAVVTSGNRPVAQARLRAAGFGEPAVLVSADDITAGKPDPQGCEMAARLLGVMPQACVVVEDAVAGLQAAAAAGMRAVAVEGQTGPLPAPYAHAVRSLTQVSARLG